MKYFPGIIAVLAVFISHNEATPDFEMNNLYLKAHEIRLSLQLYRTRVAEQENRKFAYVAEFLKQESTERINGVIEAVGIGNNKDCEKSLKSKLNEAQSVYLMSLEKCINETRPDWKSGRSEWNTDKWITDLVAIGEVLEAKIDNLRNSCFDHNSGVFEQCLTQFLPELGLSIESYQAEEGKLRTLVQVKTGIGFMNCGICFNEANDDFTMNSRTARTEALKCIRPE